MNAADTIAVEPKKLSRNESNGFLHGRTCYGDSLNLKKSRLHRNESASHLSLKLVGLNSHAI